MLKIIKKNSIQTTRLQIKLLTNDDITKTFMVFEIESSEQVKDLANKLINFSQISDFNHLEYGIYLNDFLNGFAIEAVQAVLQELKYMGFKKVVAGFFEENKDSYRVMKNVI